VKVLGVEDESGSGDRKLSLGLKHAKVKHKHE
jgi:hypothetical protein